MKKTKVLLIALFLPLFCFLSYGLNYVHPETGGLNMYMNSPYWEERRRKQSLKRSKKEFDQLSDAITQAYRSFNNTADPAQMDACIYEINALRVKRDSVLREIRKLE